ncbi:MAG: hypothetical protein Q4D04_14775, partial [Clostridia bacterium]|nr:hypothetical protein [Clostridia bacterium]
MKKASLKTFFSSPIAVCAAILIAAFILLGLFAGLSTQLVMTRIVCMALVAVSLNLQFGYGGMTNMGGGLIFSLASYAVMVASMRFGWPLLPSILFALIIMIPVSAFIGYIC